MFPALIRLAPLLTVFLMCLDAPIAFGQRVAVDGARALSDALAHRVANAREVALERKDIKAVRALLRVAGAFPDQSAYANETQLAGELLKVEEHLGITESEAPAGAPAPAVFVPHQLHADIHYTGDVEALNPQQTLDIYSPAEAVKAPVLIWIHGGGLTGGDKAHPGLTLIKPDFFLAHGFVFVSVNYRLMPDHVYPAFMNDAAQAVAWIHNNITKFGGDPEKLNLIGHSAGAHIASLMATNQSFLERQGKARDIIKSVLSLDIASYDIARRLKEMGSERASTLYMKAYGDEERVWIEASPARQIEPQEGLPAFLLLYAGNHHDAALMRAENEAFFKQLEDHGTTTRLYEAADRTHESVNLRIGFRGDPASHEIISFLREIGMVEPPVARE
jgi:acetyl esterase/lipase